MPHFLRDGSILSTQFKIMRKKTAFVKKKSNFAIIKARVDEVIYADDEKNSTRNSNNPQVEYSCTILGGNESGKRLFHVKSVTPLGSGSFYNSGEIIQTAKLDGSPQDLDGNSVNSPEKTTGSLVLLSRIHGSDQSPVIIANLKHPNSTSTKKEDGQRLKWEYAGVGLEITKDGAFSLTFGGGPKDFEGKPADEAGAGGAFKFTKDGLVQITDGDGQQITIDKKNKKVKIESSQDVQLQTGANWSIDVSGNANLTAGGAVNIDGATISLGGGGLQAARINDIVLGTDSHGGPIDAFIGVGSSVVLIGG